MIEFKNPVKRSDEMLNVSENTINSSWHRRNYLFKRKHSKIILGCVVKNYIYIIIVGYTVKILLRKRVHRSYRVLCKIIIRPDMSIAYINLSYQQVPL